MPDVSVPWGQDQELTFTLPENWTVQQVARPQIKPASRDWPDRLAAALAQPCTGLPLAKLLAARPGGKIAIIIEDMTRHSPVEELLAVVMREIEHAGVSEDQIEVTFATGMHPAMTPEEAAGKLGEKFKHLRWRCNPAEDPKAHVRVGRAGKTDISIARHVVEADLRIVLSSVSPHLQAGFGGGNKMLLPGCAPRESIRLLHRLGLGRTATQLVGTDGGRNAMRAVIDAVGDLVDAVHGKTFTIQYLLDDNDQPSAVAAGDPVPTQQMLAKQCAAACGIVPVAPADVLITNAYPRDFDLWQSFKCVGNTLWAARPNGIVICLTRCQAGANGMRSMPWPLNPTWTRRLLNWMGPETLSSLVMRLVPGLAADAAFFARMAAQACNRNPIYMVSQTLHSAGMKFPGMDIFATPADAIATARKALGDSAQRVTVFPNGGITFPAPMTHADRGTEAQNGV